MADLLKDVSQLTKQNLLIDQYSDKTNFLFE